jgi:hypothetical protein
VFKPLPELLLSVLLVPRASAGDTVVDVGANIDVFGVRALSLVPGGDLHYIGIEPPPLPLLPT